MICPQCHSEYRPGFDRCAECNVPLVEHLDEAVEIHADSQSQDDQLVTVFESQSTALMSDVVAALEESQIPYILESGTAFQYSQKLSGRATEGLGWDALLWVPQTVMETAREIIDKVEARTSATPSQTEEE